MDDLPSKPHLYLEQECQEQETENTDIEELLEEEKKRLRNKKKKVRDKIQERERIHEQNLEELKQHIREQINELQAAGATENEHRIKDRIQHLYDQKRELPRRKWLDTEDLHQYLWHLEEKIKEIEDSEEIQSLLNSV